MTVRDRQRLELVIRLIEMIRKRLEGKSRADLFVDDRVELDVTSFRLLHIGENTHRLSPDVKARHPEIPWSAIYQLRNVTAHGYDQIKPELIWGVIGARLLELDSVCRAELAGADPIPGSPAALP